MQKIYKFILIIIASLLIHELGHIIMGGGITGFKYSPDFDPLSFQIFMINWNIASILAGFLFTLPLLILKVYPQYLFVILLFESRWDLLSLYVNSILDLHI